MNRLLARILVLVISITSMSLVSIPAQAAPGDYYCDLAGAGTSASPFMVATKNDLLEIPDCDVDSSKKYFAQTANIDLGSGNWTPIDSFSGEYDGRDHEISNLAINLPTTDNVGLFAYTGRSAVVRDLRLKVRSIVGQDHVGSLFGVFAGAFLDDIVVEPENNTYISTKTATSYSVASNVVVINIGANHGIVVGAQFSLGDLAIGPLPSRTTHVVSDVNSGAGTISVSFVANDISSQALSPTVNLSIANPLIFGRSRVGGLMGRASGYYASALNSQLHLQATGAMSLDVTGSVAGSYSVGGVVGTSERMSYISADFVGQVSAIEGASNRFIGGLAGISYESRWDGVYFQGSVSGGSSGVGGLFGMLDDRGAKPYCVAGSPSRFTSVSSTNANEVVFVYPAGTDHELEVGFPVALRVFANFNAPAAISDGALGSVTQITGGGLSPIEIKVAVTTTTFASANYHPNDFLLRIRLSNQDCGSGVEDGAAVGTVTGGVDGNGDSHVGGLVGMATNTFFKNVIVEADVFAPGDKVGGVAGYSQGSHIDGAFFGTSEYMAHDNASVRGFDRVGGIAGSLSGHIRGGSSGAQYQVSGSGLEVLSAPISGHNYVGGLAGSVSAFSVTGSSSEASVEGMQRVGGLFGEFGYSATVSDSTYDGSWVFGPDGYVGGIAGVIQGTESAFAITGASSLSATVTRFTVANPHFLLAGDHVWVKFASEGQSQIVRVVNIHSETAFDVSLATDGVYNIANGDEIVEFNGIMNSHVTKQYPVGNAGSIRADDSYIGGLVGSLSSGVIEDSSNKLQLRIGLGSGVDGQDIGGLVGNAYFGTPLLAYIKDSFSTANIYADANFRMIRDVGGLVGQADGMSIRNSYFQGDINFPSVLTGTEIANIGGIVGSGFNSQVSSVFAKANITSRLGYKVGGLMGENFTTSNIVGVVGSFFDGSIAITNGTKVGGLVGGGNQDITASHVNATISADTKVGGLLGEPAQTLDITKSYFDGQITRTDNVTTNETVGDTQGNGFNGDLTTAYWNSTAQATSQLTQGAKTATQLATAATFASWTGFSDYFYMPAANSTAKPYPTLGALDFAPGALEVVSPSTDLNGIMVNTQIVPIQTKVWAYPRPVLEVTGTLPAGLSVQGMTVSGAPTIGGAYNFTLAAKNPVGTGAGTLFTGTIAGGAPVAAPSYDGPTITGHFPRAAMVGEIVTITGTKLGTVSAVKIGGELVPVSNVSDTAFTFVVPSAARPGVQDLVVVSSYGELTSQGAISITSTQTIQVRVKQLTSTRSKVYLTKLPAKAKVQILVDGKEIAWFGPTKTKGVKSSSTGEYFVRTLSNLKPGSIIEVRVRGKAVFKTTN